MLKISAPAPNVNLAAPRSGYGHQVEIPVEFDPRRFPIIARHIFGLDLTHSVGRAAAALVADLRFRNKMAVLLAMGDRPATEMVAELAVGHGLEAAIDQLLDKYIELDDSALDVVGGRDFLPPPLHEVR